jgi:hypothetical protein
VAKVKSIIDEDQLRLYGTLDENLNGTYFTNTASQTIFSFGSFVVTSNLEGRVPIDYTNKLSSFVRAVTLETMGVTDVQSQILHDYSTNAVLNLDKSDLNTFVRFGSAYEFLRNTIETIILAYPGSLFINSQVVRGGNLTYDNYVYNSTTNTSTFTVPISSIVNKFNLVYNYGNKSIPDNVELKNLNLSYTDYVIWFANNNNSYSVIGFTGYTGSDLFLKVSGNPFSGITNNSIDFHIKPNNLIFEEFRALLTDYQKYILSERATGSTSGFKFTLKDPTLLEDGTIVYSDSKILWTTGDKYNIDIDTPNYRKFLDIVLTIGNKYDTVKTDLIARFLTPTSIKTYDLTEEGKMTKLLRVYGWEFDQLRKFIDSLVYINRVTYDKINNIPDQLVKNLARTFGWDYFSLVNEAELVESFLTIDNTERNLNTDLLPAEIDVELWRRILINTNYFWKAKGTREAIKSMFLLIGIPEPFINITEYVYTVDSKINPNSVTLTQADFPSNSLPYDTNGYPKAPIETNNFYFQLNGNADSGQAYMNAFRMAGFDLTPIVDNKKSWVQTGATTRIDDTTPQYYQEDSRLVINTKEVDVALDIARGIEYDVYSYIQDPDFKYNSSGYTLPFSYVNISLNYTGTQNTFTLPYNVDTIEGDFEVRYNGILLNAPKFNNTGDTNQADYTVSGNQFTLLTESAYTNPYRRDVIQATFIYSGTTHPVTGITVEYIVTRVKANLLGTVIPLPSYPRGDVQVTINGIALTKGTPQFTADYILDPANSTGGTNNIIIQNPDVISYLAVNPDVQIAYVWVAGSNDINARSEVYRVDSFSGSKLYYNSTASKYVYKLNYKLNNASEVKLLIDGIALEPYTDYSVNVNNPYEIFLPNGIKYGTVISAYYLIANSSYFTPIVNDIFGIGDISQLSFLEFIDLIQRKMINARNRKTITDFKGGWYPTLLKIYIEYLKRAELPDSDLFQSNGYTFENLYSFLSKYNAFFQKFVDQLLSATIILKKGGLLIRNSIFTKQKFTYKRGVNLYATGSTTMDVRGNPMLQYLGNDGSEFVIVQNTAPAPIELHVDTISGISGTYGIGLGYIGSTGGEYISGYTIITDYGMEYKCCSDSAWQCEPNPLYTIPLSATTYPATISGLTEGSCYLYRAIVKSDTIVAYGDTLGAYIPVTPPIPTPSLRTITATTITSSALCCTGGYDICRWEDIQWYGMHYRAIGCVAYTGTTDILISPTALTYTSTGGTQCVTICGSVDTSFSIINPISGWTTTETPEPLLPVGISHSISTTANISVTRNGLLCYIPVTCGITGATKCVCISQACGAPLYNAVGICCYTWTGVNCVTPVVSACGCFTYSKARAVGECFYPTFCWYLCKPATTNIYQLRAELYCNGTMVNYRNMSCTCSLNCSGSWSRCVDYNDCITMQVYATAPALPCAKQSKPSVARIDMTSIGAGVGNYCRCLSSCSICVATCSAL